MLLMTKCVSVIDGAQTNAIGRSSVYLLGRDSFALPILLAMGLL
jgi:hypothetical protein